MNPSICEMHKPVHICKYEQTDEVWREDRPVDSAENKAGLFSYPSFG